ncbi:YbaB/EbfC family nucleoid-associated protein [Candidatus Uhrbacteria bacterium]|nr:YbaB/EbfC family nucleoid-associated protein [Candidatus Uhrbacteria bacterium]
MFQKLKQIKDMRDKAKRVQRALEGKTAEGSGAWGKVKVTVSGNQEILSITIDPEFLKQADAAKVGEAVKEATNDGLKKAQRLMVEKMREMGEIKL